MPKANANAARIRERTVPSPGDCAEGVDVLQRAGALEIKTFTGEKTLTNAVALFLHA